MHAKTIKVLMIGDIVGNTGCRIFQQYSAKLRTQIGADFLIVNGENSASNGRGITESIVKSLKHNGADVITSGNHIWAQKDIMPYLQAGNTDLLRPANFPSACPGDGLTTVSRDGVTIGVINIQGRVFMREQVDDPFKTLDSILTYLQTKTKLIFVDVHAETTAEKQGIAHYLDGRVTGVVGTHTHVQTADERILPGGTAFITDLGMVGSLNSMIGMKKEPIIWNMRTQLPVRFEVDDAPPYVLAGVWIEADVATGKAVTIERVRIVADQ